MRTAQSILSPGLLGLALLAAPALAQERVDPATSQAAHRQAKQSKQVESKQDSPQKAKSKQAKPHRPKQQRPQQERAHAAPDKRHAPATSQRGAQPERPHQAAQGQEAPPVRRPQGAAGTLTSYPNRVQGSGAQGAESGQRPTTDAPGSRWERVDATEAESIEQTQRALNEGQARGSADPGRTASDPALTDAARERAAAASMLDTPAAGRPRTEDPAVIEARRRGATGVRRDGALNGGGSQWDQKLAQERRSHQERINKLIYSREMSLQRGNTHQQRRIDSLMARENQRYEAATQKLAAKRNAARIEELKRNPEPTLNRLDARNATREEPAAGERPDQGDRSEQVDRPEAAERPESPERIEP